MTMIAFRGLRPRGSFVRRWAPSLTRPWRCLSTTSSTETPVVTLGILRETYDPWERRCPLTPHHVKELRQKRPNVRVLIQPCQRRVFPNSEYEQAGAILTKDLSEADLIIGVKRPADESLLIPKKTYMFFSHTIKGQPENMPLLRACLDQKVQLLDYERLLDDTSESKMKRLVSFGRFAGLAGAIDTLHGMGRRLLSEGQSTPLLSCPPAILCDDLAQAQDRLHQIGQKISTQGLHRNEPMVISITGQGGCVHGGVMEMLDLLPHEIVPVSDLPALFAHETGSQQNQLYLVPIATEEAFEKILDGSFDRNDYSTNPSDYRSTIPSKIAPYTTTLINCAYWDPRFPRLLTKSDMRMLHNNGEKRQVGWVGWSVKTFRLSSNSIFLQLYHCRLRFVADISCDVHGSIEFLERTTTIDKPFFQYDPFMETEVADTVNDMGITILGVDILPTELPVESSQHFGNKLMGVLEELIDAKAKNYDTKGIPTYTLSNGVAHSAITTANGRLTMQYRYLQQLMNDTGKATGKDSDMALLAIRLEGHLFDSGIINKVLDTIETHGYGVHIDEFVLPKHRPDTRIKSSILLTIVDKIHKESRWYMVEELEKELHGLISESPEAEATMTRVALEKRQHVTVTDEPPAPKVLVLGSGFVARSALESLARSSTNVTLVSNDQSEAASLASAYDNVDYVVLDVQADKDRLARLIGNASVVLSLLPAPMHPLAAELCINEKTHLVTSSYESDELREMEDSMKKAGIISLNEVGLDPGLDHMSAMRLIDNIHGRGGEVISFSSVCGGLPTPEASKNPFGYKFSWSPRGVLRASTAPARYLEDDNLVVVRGESLLDKARPFIAAWPEMSLEVLPNRDSTKYSKVYGIPSTRTIFRGTLRYRGFSSLLATLRNMGLLDEEFKVGDTWYSTIMDLTHRRGFKQLEDFALACAQENLDEASRALKALEWLDMLKETETHSTGAVVDAFCHVLEDRLRYNKGEHDMILMHHDIQAIFDDGGTESHVSSLHVRGSEEFSAMSQT